MRTWRRRKETLGVLGEYAKRHKSVLSQLIIKKFKFLKDSFYLHYMEWIKPKNHLTLLSLSNLHDENCPASTSEGTWWHGSLLIHTFKSYPALCWSNLSLVPLFCSCMISILLFLCCVPFKRCMLFAFFLSSTCVILFFYIPLSELHPFLVSYFLLWLFSFYILIQFSSRSSSIVLLFLLTKFYFLYFLSDA